jgi:hypothetical protein
MYAKMCEVSSTAKNLKVRERIILIVIVILILTIISIVIVILILTIISIVIVILILTNNLDRNRDSNLDQ